MSTLATVEFAEMHDIDRLNQLLDDWQISSIQLGRGKLRLTNRRIVFPDLVVEHSSQNLSRRDEYFTPPDTTVFCFFASGSQPGMWCGFEIPADVVLVNHASREHFAVLPKAHTHIAIAIDNQLLSQWHLLPPSWIDQRPMTNQSIIPLANPEGGAFRDWLFALFNSQPMIHSLESSPEQSMAFREQLLIGLGKVLDLGIGLQGSQRRAAKSVGRFETLKKACDVIEQHLSEKISPTEIAGSLAINVRSLQRAFGDVLGMTAYQYVQIRKLHAVHRELRLASTHATVSSTAMKYGFTELGRFSVRYRELFGQRPSDTLHRTN